MSQNKKHIDLSVEFCGIRLENPFILASAPPTANFNLIKRGLEAGWAGVVVKTIVPKPSPSLRPRFSSNKIGNNIISFGNIEQLSTKDVENWIPDLKKIREQFPHKCLIISVLGEGDSSSWINLIEKTQDIGPDMFELNLSCPHYIEKGSSISIGQDASLAAKVMKQARNATDIPIMPKLTSTVTDITAIGNAVKTNGADALSAINSIQAFMGININTIEVIPAVEDLSAFGGLSGPAIKPIALKCVIELAKKVNLPISGGGGITNWEDAVQFLMCGATTLQSATAVMYYGYKIIDDLTNGLSNYLSEKGFGSVKDIMGIINDRIVDPSDLRQDNNIYYIVDKDKCTGCKACYTACQDGGFEAITFISDKKALIDKNKCDGCSLCVQVCPVKDCIQPAKV